MLREVVLSVFRKKSCSIRYWKFPKSQIGSFLRIEISPRDPGTVKGAFCVLAWFLGRSVIVDIITISWYG